MERRTTKSFMIAYFNGKTGEVLSYVSVLNNDGKEVNPQEKAVYFAHSHLLLHSSVMWDINEIKEEDPVVPMKSRKVRGFSNSFSAAPPHYYETA